MFKLSYGTVFVTRVWYIVPLLKMVFAIDRNLIRKQVKVVCLVIIFLMGVERRILVIVAHSLVIIGLKLHDLLWWYTSGAWVVRVDVIVYF